MPLASRVLPLCVAVLLLSPAARAEDACLDASEAARARVNERALLEARRQLRICAAPACDDPIRSLCGERLAEVVSRIPTVLFETKTASGDDVSDARLSVDGSLQEDTWLGTELALDPGPHVFVFERPNGERAEVRLVMLERERARRSRIWFLRVEPAPRATRAEPVAPPPVSPLPRILGWSAIGVGAVAMGIGGAFGVDAILKNEDANCDARNVCDDPRSRHDARTSATVATIGVAVGAVAIVAGVTLLLVPWRRSPAAAIASGTVATW